jgi:hypothetical protein
VSSDECSGSRPSPDDLGRTRAPGVKRPPCRQREHANMRASMCSAIKTAMRAVRAGDRHKSDGGGLARA